MLLDTDWLLLNARGQANQVRSTVFGGADTITLGSTGNAIILNGDGGHVEPGQTVHGSNDVVTGDLGSGYVGGDFGFVDSGGTAYGGDDTINVTGTSAAAFGDVSTAYGVIVAGDDTITAGAGMNLIFGDADAIGSSGTVNGFAVGGDDTIVLNTNATALAYGDVLSLQGTLVGGDDTIKAGAGNSFAVNLIGDAAIVESDSFVRAGDDLIEGGSYSDMLFGDVGTIYGLSKVKCGDDTIVGNGGDDTIYGDWNYRVNLSGPVTGGKDLLYGGAGADTIYGDGGDDLINGGADADRLTGGDGKDIFVFNAALSKLAVDTLVDFNQADDAFHVENAVFKGLKAGNLSKNDFKLISSATSKAGVDTSDRILYDKAHGDLYFDGDGSGKKEDRILFATVEDNTSVDYTDFIII